MSLHLNRFERSALCSTR